MQLDCRPTASDVSIALNVLLYSFIVSSNPLRGKRPTYLDCIASDVSVLVLNVLFYRLCNYCESNSEELLINLFYSYLLLHIPLRGVAETFPCLPLCGHTHRSLPAFMSLLTVSFLLNLGLLSAVSAPSSFRQLL